MREIKFRAWNELSEDMENELWDLEADPKGNGWMTRVSRNNVYESWYGNEIILMQYTGLKDKHGVDIYEGDIIDWGGLKPIVIVWKDGGFKSDWCGTGNEIIKLSKEGMSNYAKVIGNIHANPELMETP